MAWAVQLPVKSLDPAYDPYVNRLALLEDDKGEPVAYLVTHAERASAFRGFRNWRPHHQVVELFIGFCVPLDGSLVEECYPSLEQLETGRLGDQRLNWLQGEEFDAWWQRYLDEWGPDEPSRDTAQLDVDADRFVLVFEDGGHVHVETTLVTGLESPDLEHYVAAFYDDGEVLDISIGEDGFWLVLHPTGRQDPTALRQLLADSIGPSSLAGQPRAYAATLHRRRYR